MAALALLTVHVAMFSGLLGTRAFGTPRPPSNVVGAFFVSGLPSFIGVFFVLPAMFLYLPLAKAIIAGSKAPPQRSQLLRRLVRLLPGYYLMCAVALVAINRDAIDGVWYLLRPFLLLQVYLPNPFVPNLMNGLEVTWTVPSMVQWYLALPLIAWATHRFAARGATPAIRARRLMLPVPVLIGIGVGWLFFVKAQGWDNRIVFWWPQGFAPSIGVGMALAILLARTQVTPGDIPRVFQWAATHPNRFWLGALAVYLVNCARPFSVIGMDAIYSVSGLLVTYLMVTSFGLLASLPLISPGARRHAIRTFLGTGPIAYLGKISYGVYLWHFAMMHFYLQPHTILRGNARPIRELYGTSGFWRLELATFAGSVILAAISYHLVEQPLAARFDRFLRADRGPGRTGSDVARAPAMAASIVPVQVMPATPTMTPQEIPSAVATAAAERDAIRSNLVELEGSFGRQLAGSADSTGLTRERWAAAAADLATLWECFDAYSGVVDDAVRTVTATRHPGTADLHRAAGLLTGPAVLVIGTPAPLARRHITDDGRRRMALPAAVEQMNQLFTGIAALIGATEAVHDGVAGQLDRIEARLAHVRRHAGETAATTADGTTLAEALAEADESVRRLRLTLATDPLALWHEDRIECPELDDLRQHSARLTELIHHAEPGDDDDARD